MCDAACRRSPEGGVQLLRIAASREPLAPLVGGEGQPAFGSGCGFAPSPGTFSSSSAAFRQVLRE
jgi:hypothetical protein